MKLSYLEMDSFPNVRITQTVVIDRKFGGKPWAETHQRLLHFAAVSIEVHGHGRCCLRRGNHEAQGTKTDLKRALKIHQYTSITYHLAIINVAKWQITGLKMANHHRSSTKWVVFHSYVV